MGGSVAGVGNIRPGVEFNFAADAESARMLFDAVTQAQITLVPLETSVNAKMTKVYFCGVCLLVDYNTMIQCMHFRVDHYENIMEVWL